MCVCIYKCACVVYIHTYIHIYTYIYIHIYIQNTLYICTNKTRYVKLIGLQIIWIMYQLQHNKSRRNFSRYLFTVFTVFSSHWQPHCAEGSLWVESEMSTVMLTYASLFCMDCWNPDCAILSLSVLFATFEVQLFRNL